MMSSENRNDPRLRAVLDAFLEFRVADMDIWRRAGQMLDLTTNAMMVLAVVLRSHYRGEIVRQVDLRNAVHLSAAGASTIIDGLEERGLVRREPFEGDRRALRIVPTIEGHRIEEIVAEADDHLLDLLASMEPNEVAAVQRVFDAMRVYGAQQFPLDG